MSPELSPEHAKVARKAIERIKRSIARAVFGAADNLDPEENENTKTGQKQ